MIRTPNFVVEAETKVDVLNFCMFEPETFLSLFLSYGVVHNFRISLLLLLLFFFFSRRIHFIALPQLRITRR